MVIIVNLLTALKLIVELIEAMIRLLKRSG